MTKDQTLGVRKKTTVGVELILCLTRLREPFAHSSKKSLSPLPLSPIGSPAKKSEISGGNNEPFQ